MFAAICVNFLLYRKEYTILVKININNLTVIFKGNIVVRLRARFAAELSLRFTLIYLLFCINLLTK